MFSLFSWVKHSINLPGLAEGKISSTDTHVLCPFKHKEGQNGRVEASSTKANGKNEAVSAQVEDCTSETPVE